MNILQRDGRLVIRVPTQVGGVDGWLTLLLHTIHNKSYILIYIHTSYIRTPGAALL